MSDSLFVVNPDVVYTRLGDEEAVLLNIKTQVYYTINETGVTVWEMLAQPRGIEEIAATLAANYEVDPEEARKFAASFTADLERDGLIQSTSEAA